MINTSYVNLFISGQPIDTTVSKVSNVFIRWSSSYVAPLLYLEVSFISGMPLDLLLVEGAILTVQMGTSPDDMNEPISFMLTKANIKSASNNYVNYALYGYYYSSYLYPGKSWQFSGSPIDALQEVISLCDLGGAQFLSNLSVTSSYNFKFFKSSRIDFGSYLKNYITPCCVSNENTLPMYCHTGNYIVVSDLYSTMQNFDNDHVIIIPDIIVSNWLVSKPSSNHHTNYSYGANISQYSLESGETSNNNNSQIFINTQYNYTAPTGINKAIASPLNIGNEDQQQFFSRINSIRTSALYNTLREITISARMPGLLPGTAISITQSTDQQYGNYVLIGKTIISYNNIYYEKLLVVSASVYQAQIPATS